MPRRDHTQHGLPQLSELVGRPAAPFKYRFGDSITKDRANYQQTPFDVRGVCTKRHELVLCVDSDRGQ